MTPSLGISSEPSKIFRNGVLSTGPATSGSKQTTLEFAPWLAQAFTDRISKMSPDAPTSLRTTILPDLLARLRRGDRTAADELLRRCGERLEAIARVMLRRFPTVSAREQTGDVVQEATLSLLAALRKLEVADTQSFYALAAEHVSRRLLDLARKHRRRDTPPAAEDLDADLGRWADLHEAARCLSDGPREVFALRFYHGLTLAEIATLLNVSVATARRRWLQAEADLALNLREFPE